MNKYQIIMQEDDPNAFPAGTLFAVYHDEGGTIVHFATRKECAKWIAEQVAQFGDK